MSVTRKSHLAELKRTLHDLAKVRVLVGIPQETAGRQTESNVFPEVEPSKLNNALLGYFHEFGVPEVNIPPRPFLVPAVKENLPALEKRMQLAARAAFAGDNAGMMRQFYAVGIAAQSAVRMFMTIGEFMPLKPSTIAARRSRGFMGTHPLLETGRLRQAITFAIANVDYKQIIHVGPTETGKKDQFITPQPKA